MPQKGWEKQARGRAVNVHGRTVRVVRQRVSVLQGPSVNNAPTVSTDSTPIRSRLSRGYFPYTNRWLYYRSRQITIFTLHCGFKSQHFNTDELYSELLTSISLLLAGTSREVWFIEIYLPKNTWKDVFNLARPKVQTKNCGIQSKWSQWTGRNILF